MGNVLRKDCDSLHIVEISDNVNDWRIFSGKGGVEISFSTVGSNR